MTTTPQANYLVLQPGVPVTVRVTRAYTETREAYDKSIGQIMPKITMVLVLSHVNGLPRITTWSTLSQKARNNLQPMIDSGQLFQRPLEITVRGQGYNTEYELRLL